MSKEELASVNQWGYLTMPSVLAAAHELKSPLVLLRQLSFELELAGSLSPDQVRVQQRLRMTAERTLRLVDSITKSARLDDAMFALEPLQIGALLGDVAAEMGPVAKEHGQILESILPRSPLLIVAHKELLLSILMGLCDNALAHNPSGETVRVSSRKHKSKVIISVRDQGPMIEKSVFDSLENRLGSMPQPLGVRPRSSGLGLWIAGSFARAMSSELRATRHREGGMTFSLHVPISGQLSLL